MTTDPRLSALRRKHKAIWRVTLNVVGEDDLIYVYINGDGTTRKFAETAATLRCARDLGISRKHISVVTARLT